MQKLTEFLASLPQPGVAPKPSENRDRWEMWFESLSKRPDLPSDLPPLRLLLVIGNLAGHKSDTLVQRFFSQGIIPLYIRLSGSLLNMAESLQLILERRTLDGQHSIMLAQIIDWLETTAGVGTVSRPRLSGGGKQATRRVRQRQRQQAKLALGGSGARIGRHIRQSKTIIEKWRSTCQLTLELIYEIIAFAIKPSPTIPSNIARIMIRNKAPQLISIIFPPSLLSLSSRLYQLISGGAQHICLSTPK